MPPTKEQARKALEAFEAGANCFQMRKYPHLSSQAHSDLKAILQSLIDAPADAEVNEAIETVKSLIPKTGFYKTDLANLTAMQTLISAASRPVQPCQCEGLVEAVDRLIRAKRPTYHDCLDNGEPECEWCLADKALTAHREKAGK